MYGCAFCAPPPHGIPPSTTRGEGLSIVPLYFLSSQCYSTSIIVLLQFYKNSVIILLELHYRSIIALLSCYSNSSFLNNHLHTTGGRLVYPHMAPHQLISPLMEPFKGNPKRGSIPFPLIINTPQPNPQYTYPIYTYIHVSFFFSSYTYIYTCIYRYMIYVYTREPTY